MTCCGGDDEDGDAWLAQYDAEFSVWMVGFRRRIDEKDDDYLL